MTFALLRARFREVEIISSYEMRLYLATKRAISPIDRSGATERVATTSFDACHDPRGARPVKIAKVSGAIGCVFRRMYADRPAPPGLNAASARSVAIHVSDLGLRYAESPVQQDSVDMPSPL
jgi:hypothetical protein